ncbi:GNAT family N-acetyltransferase [Schaalia sp. ZJ1691]|uniref:GNAT family N-acetyltransferase n=1 Tax=Schaalia sp. ZJ1691 TaxID=2709404 RepID=UPI0013EDF3FE|nr:GNAT family N-acetyltransferase [Schaalia sp. ZJ1691]
MTMPTNSHRLAAQTDTPWTGTMNSGGYRVVEAITEEHRLGELAVRWDVFVVEQHCPIVCEIDARDYDPAVIHFVCLATQRTVSDPPSDSVLVPDTTDEQVGDVGGEYVVGCVRLIPDEPGHFHLGRLAVRKEYRSEKIGAALVRGLHEYLAAHTPRGSDVGVVLNAQVQAAGFYAKQGYVVTSKETFWEAGIEHVEMARRISGTADCGDGRLD